MAGAAVGERTAQQQRRNSNSFIPENYLRKCEYTEHCGFRADACGPGLGRWGARGWDPPASCRIGYLGHLEGGCLAQRSPRACPKHFGRGGRHSPA